MDSLHKKAMSWPVAPIEAQIEAMEFVNKMMAERQRAKTASSGASSVTANPPEPEAAPETAPPPEKLPPSTK